MYEQENEFLKTQIKDNYEGIEFWIGLREKDTKDTYQWVDKSDISYGKEWKKSPWHSSEPDKVCKNKT